MSCIRCGCLVELDEWEPAEDSGIRDTLPGEEPSSPEVSVDSSSPEVSVDSSSPGVSVDSFAPDSARESGSVFTPKEVSGEPGGVSRPADPEPEQRAPVGASAHEEASPKWLASFDNESDDRPCEPHEIFEALGDGRLDGGSLLWRAGMQAWAPVREIPEFAAFLPSTTPPAGTAAAVVSTDPHSLPRELESDPLAAPSSTGVAEAVQAPDPPLPQMPPAAQSGEEQPRPGRGFLLLGLLLLSAAGAYSVFSERLPADSRASAPAMNAPERRSGASPMSEARNIHAGENAPSLNPPVQPAAEAEAAEVSAVGADPAVQPSAPFKASAPAKQKAAPAKQKAAPAKQKAAPAKQKAAPAKRKRASRPATPKTPKTPGASPAGGETAQKRPAPPTATFAPVDESAAGPFQIIEAKGALAQAAGEASSCRKPGDPSGTAQIRVTFANSGRVTQAVVQGKPFAGTATGSCIAEQLRGAKVPPFSGKRRTLTKTVVIQ